MKPKFYLYVVMLGAIVILALGTSLFIAANRSVEQGETAMFPVQIKSLGLQLDLLAGLVEMNKDDNSVRYCFEEELRSRYIRCFSISRISDVPMHTDSWNSILLEDEGTFVYEVRQVANPGSGGPVATLNGYLEIGGEVFEVKANAQSEIRPPDPTWVLPIIQSVHALDDMG